MNREPFQNGEYYHIYNRGTDKRKIFNDFRDVDRFLKSMRLFNSVEPIGSVWLQDLIQEKNTRKKLVAITAYCLNPNHYHLILQQRIENGITEFMKRLNGGYTWYFNFKTKRTGALFQGRFKSKHIFDDDYLLRVSAYVNLNDHVHQLSGSTAQLVRSSWNEYTSGTSGLCEKKIIFSQFRKWQEYEKFALEALPQILQRKEDEKELKSLMLE